MKCFSFPVVWPICAEKSEWFEAKKDSNGSNRDLLIEFLVDEILGTRKCNIAFDQTKFATSFDQLIRFSHQTLEEEKDSNGLKKLNAIENSHFRFKPTVICDQFVPVCVGIRTNTATLRCCWTEIFIEKLFTRYFVDRFCWHDYWCALQKKRMKRNRWKIRSL